MDQRHIVFVENNMEDIIVLHPTSCNKVEPDGYQEMDCSFDHQIAMVGFDVTGITNDGTYLVEPWFTPAEYHSIGGYICDADSGMHVTELTEVER